MPNTTSHITTSGGLFPTAFVHNLRELKIRQPGAEPDSFGLPWADPGRTENALEETIATTWELLRERWDAVHADLPEMNISDVRNRWLLPLFQLLDFEPAYQRGDTVLDEAEELRFPLSHRGWEPEEGEHAPVLHSEVPAQGLDERMDRGGGARSPKRKSPHDMLQLYLNLSRDEQWALLSNGRMLRLLRDYHHTFSKGYVQFDLEAIFETRNYGDFRALFRLCHASRFYQSQTSQVSAEDEQETSDGETAEVSVIPLEQLYRTAQAAGVKVGEDLRGQVRQAIEILGNGFLYGPARDPSTALPLRQAQGFSSAQDDNGERGSAQGQSPLFQRLQDDPELARQFYGEILQVIYRILFLLFAEQRGLVPRAGAPLEELYHSHYSITALRAEGDIPRGESGQAFTDLWEGLRVTFRMVREGAPALGVFGYNGMLFDDSVDDNGATAEAVTTNEMLLHRRTIPNNALLQAIRHLTLIERDGVLVRISYADLGVEELGSIYESLLDYTPRVTSASEEVNGREIPANRFFLDPRGLERKSSGSYYTHPALVNELIKSALLPVMRDRLAQAGLPVSDADASGTTSTGLLEHYGGLTADQREAGAEALLALNVCDPAAGSGHFLVKANNAVAAELARIRSGDDYPTEAELGAARRDTLTHCIYAVDLNPMAVELCKVSLWINASVADRPLSFLDHHIKVGNSLVGATPELLKDGIPYDAFALGRAGDDREVAKHFRKVNREERRDYEQSGGLFQPRFRVVALFEREEDVHDYFQRLEALADVAPNQARERYLEYVTGSSYQRQKLLADFWTAAFFWPMPEGTTWAPTFADFKRLQQEGPEALPPERLAQVQGLAEEHRFFHWHIEFPDVFDEQKVGFAGDGSGGNGEARAGGATGEKGVQKPGFPGGFDVILGNPPWERIKLQEKEFFADKAPAIANARTASQRKKLIKQLPETDPALYAAYRIALHFSEALSSFLRESGRYPLSAVGDINTYQIFAGLVRQITASRGRAGIIVPSGVGTDYYNQDYFNAIVQNRELVSLYDFENRQGIFPEVHRSYKFSLLTLRGSGREEAPPILFAFFLGQPDQLADEERVYTLTPTELRQINPNTGTCPTFRTRTDAELTKKLYRRTPILDNQAAITSPWETSFFTMFHMRNDAELLLVEEELSKNEVDNLQPMLEAKMVQQYDHRAAGVGEGKEGTLRLSASLETTSTEHRDPDYFPPARFWVDHKHVRKYTPNHWPFEWFLGFKAVTSPTNERTMIAVITPRLPLPDRLPTILFAEQSVHGIGSFYGNLNSFVFDYITRQKMGGITLNYYILEQIPVLPPETYTCTLQHFIVARVLELTYTAWDIKPFADDVWAEADDDLRAAIKAQWLANVEATGGGHSKATPPSWLDPSTPLHSAQDDKREGRSVQDDRRERRYAQDGKGGIADPIPVQPFMWDEERRAQIRAELDALYAHLYGLDYEELAYILDTFPIVRRKDEARYGEYRTKRMVLAMFEERVWE